MNTQSFRCLWVTKQPDGQIQAAITRRSTRELPEGEVLVEVQRSSLNYKDALAARGHKGIVSQFPHIPGIDAAGVVRESSAPQFQPGDAVLVTSFDLGAGRWGGWSELIRVPAQWVVPLPDGMNAQQAMIYGTAGLTAAISVEALIAHGIEPSAGEIAVTGASGGVGSLAVRLLSHLGYQVAAVSGKQSMHEQLTAWGAKRVLPRDAVCDSSERPLLKAQWAGAVDTVGGRTLATLLRSTRPGGCVTACGLVGGADLPLTVYPFILRGVVLAGIDSAWYPANRRREIWQKLAGPWRLDSLEELTTTVELEEVDSYVERILRGDVAGRVVVKLS